MRVFPVLLALLVLALPFQAKAQPSDPVEFYKGYLAVQAKAKSLDELLPYCTHELGDSLGKMPTEMQANYLKMNARR